MCQPDLILEASLCILSGFICTPDVLEGIVHYQCILSKIVTLPDSTIVI